MDDAADRTYQQRERVWDEQDPQTEQASDHPAGESDNENEELPFPDVVGTEDALDAVRDAEPYSPPTDPPVLPGGPEGIHVATGFGESALEEVARGGDTRGDQDILESALLILRNDSLTSTEDLHVHVLDGVIRLTGRVSSTDDAEYAQDLLSQISGVVDVVDDTEFDPSVT